MIYNCGLFEEVVIKVLFVLIGDFMEFRLLDRNDWKIVFWVMVFKCISKVVKVVFFLLSVDWLLFFFYGLNFDEDDFESVVIRVLNYMFYEVILENYVDVYEEFERWFEILFEGERFEINVFFFIYLDVFFF